MVYIGFVLRTFLELPYLVMIWFGYEISPQNSCVVGVFLDASVFRGGASGGLLEL
jgi:hypothetical protein